MSGRPRSALEPRSILQIVLRYLGTAAAGGATGGCLSLIPLTYGLGLGTGFEGDVLAGSLILLIAFGIVGAAAAIPVFGVPVMYAFAALEIENLPAYLTAGAAGGCLALGLLAHGMAVFSLAGGFYGTATAGWFWFLFRRPRAQAAERA